MLEKYQNAEFGRCPLVSCALQPVLPVGESDCPRCYTVKVFCPRCQDIYVPRLTRHSTIDGAFFGTSFPHLLFQVYPEYSPPHVKVPYVPRIYGFKVHATAYSASLKARIDQKRRTTSSTAPTTSSPIVSTQPAPSSLTSTIPSTNPTPPQ